MDKELLAHLSFQLRWATNSIHIDSENTEENENKSGFSMGVHTSNQFNIVKL